jgi:hypothetical protein
VAVPGPSARRSAMMAVKGNVCYVFGGVVEHKEKERTLGDCYALDLTRPEKWYL